MEELRHIAMRYYETAPEEVRVKVNEFFDILDVNKDGTISFLEFSSIMSQMDSRLSDPSFFNELSTENTNDLNWRDVVTLFYSDICRPWCDGCSTLIKGTYFTCETCFNGNENTFDLHLDCLAKKQFTHEHTNFIDNFALLQLSRRKRLSDNTPVQAVNPTLDAELASVLAQQNRHRKRKAAYKALETTINVASVASNCTIM